MNDFEPPRGWSFIRSNKLSKSLIAKETENQKEKAKQKKAKKEKK